MSILRSSVVKSDAVGLGLGLVITLLAYLLGLRPAMENRADAAESAAEIAELREENERLAAKVKGGTRAVASRESSLNGREVSLRPVTELNHQLARLTAAAERAGLTIENVLPGTAVATSLVVRVPVRLSGHGSFAEVYSFQDLLDRELRDTAVSGTAMRGQPSTPGDRPHFELELVWYAATAGPRPLDSAASSAPGSRDTAVRAGYAAPDGRPSR